LKEWVLDDNVTLIGLGEFQEAGAMGDPAQGCCDTHHLYPPGYTTLWVHPKTQVKYLCQILAKPPVSGRQNYEFKVTVSSQNVASSSEFKESTIKDVWARVLAEGAPTPRASFRPAEASRKEELHLNYKKNTQAHKPHPSIHLTRALLAEQRRPSKYTRPRMRKA